MIRLDAATVLLQWATGGLFFLWFTTSRHQIGAGYGWLLRGAYVTIATGGVAAAIVVEFVPARDIAAVGLILTAVFTLKRKNPMWDLSAPLVGLVGLVAASFDSASGMSDTLVSLVRIVVGAAFLGAVSDAMLLGHWYLVQPGLPRKILNEMVDTTLWLLPLETIALLLPVGMISVLTGAVDDEWNGTLGWFWVACVITTFALGLVTKAALKERSYSAVMAATGLMYLAILTAFGTDLVARAVLA